MVLSLRLVSLLSIHHTAALLCASLLILSSPVSHADIGEGVDNDFILSGLTLKHRLAADLDLELKAVHLSEDFSDGYASLGAIKSLSNSVKWKVEYFELFSAPTASRPDPRDQRVRTSLTKLWGVGDWLFIASQLVEYQTLDNRNGWRFRPAAGVVYTGELFGLSLSPSLKGEIFYDEGKNEQTFSVLNLGISIPIRSSLSLDTGLYRVHTLEDDRLYNGLKFVINQRF